MNVLVWLMCGAKSSIYYMSSKIMDRTVMVLLSAPRKYTLSCWSTIFTTGTLWFRYEIAGKARRQVKAQELWHAVVEAQTETGVPYMLYKDACNRKSNQQNLGTIRCSNLCTEIVQYTSPEEVRWIVKSLPSLKYVIVAIKTCDPKQYSWLSFCGDGMTTAISVYSLHSHPSS